MTRVIVDANVVISFLYQRAPKQRQQAANIFEKAAGSRLAVLLHQHVVAETVYVLTNVYKKPVEEVGEIISELIDMPGIKRIDELENGRLLKIWPDEIKDFGDAVVTAVAMQRSCPVATFDQQLRNSLTAIGANIYQW